MGERREPAWDSTRKNVNIWEYWEEKPKHSSKREQEKLKDFMVSRNQGVREEEKNAQIPNAAKKLMVKIC